MTRLLSLLVSMLLAVPTWACAQQAAVMSGAELGRLFLTPSERAQIDTRLAKYGDGSPPVAGQTGNSTAGAGISPDGFRFDGLIIRSARTTGLWLDGRAVRPDEVPQARIVEDGRWIEHRNAQGLIRRLRPGQSAAIPEFAPGSVLLLNPEPSQGPVR